MRAIVNVSVGQKFQANCARLEQSLEKLHETFIGWRHLPPGSPAHEETMYGFKAFALSDAALRGYQTILWFDSSIVPVRPLAPLWELIEKQGYWFSENLPYGSRGPCWTNGHWTSDASLPIFDITREQAFGIPHVIATSFGLDLRHEMSRSFLGQYLDFAKDGRTFRGPWSNESSQASKDPRVLGHRHDQTVASVLAWRLGMKLTRPPAWIVDGIPATDKTVLEIHR